MNDDILIPCPECGAELKTSTERLNDIAAKPVAFSCGHLTILRSSNLRNPIRHPSWDMPSRGLLEGVAGSCVLLGFAVWACGAVIGDPTIAHIGPWLIFGGPPVGILCIELLFGSAFLLRDILWRCSSRGRKRRRIERNLAVAKEMLRPLEKAVSEAEQRGAAERGRRHLAERATRREYLLCMSPRKFEEHVGQLFAALGYYVRVTPSSGDEGVDVYLEKNGRRAIVQCKHYTTGKVSRPDIQRVFGVLNHKQVDEAFFVATADFSRQAEEFARGKPIRLVDLDMLIEMAEGTFSEEFIRSGPTGRMTLPRKRYWRS